MWCRATRFQQRVCCTIGASALQAWVNRRAQVEQALLLFGVALQHARAAAVPGSASAADPAAPARGANAEPGSGAAAWLVSVFI